MSVIGTIIMLLIVGLVIGALARLLVPGRQDMGWGSTILLGIAGSLIGGLIVRYVTGGGSVLAFIISVIVAVALIMAFHLGGARNHTRAPLR